jgi:carbamate kinase
LQVKGGLSAAEQLEACYSASTHIAKIIKAGHQVAIVHGNGPQVGVLMEINEAAHRADNHHQVFSIDVCDAFSQGYIGYHLQNSLGCALREEGIEKSVATIITQVEVDADDPGFKNPTKPVGQFYSEVEARRIMSERKVVMKEDAGRGWRRVVPSPEPVKIIEQNTIKALFESGAIVIACGGGGIPVIRKSESSLIGVSAVIDKDFAAAKLADDLKADVLLILTTVDHVYVNFNKPNQKALHSVSIEEVKRYVDRGEFAAGSMLPKIAAAIKFVEGKKGRKAVITSLNKAYAGLMEKTGTIIGGI